MVRSLTLYSCQFVAHCQMINEILCNSRHWVTTTCLCSAARWLTMVCPLSFTVSHASPQQCIYLSAVTWWYLETHCRKVSVAVFWLDYTDQQKPEESWLKREEKLSGLYYLERKRAYALTFIVKSITDMWSVIMPIFPSYPLFIRLSGSTLLSHVSSPAGKAGKPNEIIGKWNWHFPE